MPFSSALVLHSCRRRVPGLPAAVTKDFMDCYYLSFLSFYLLKKKTKQTMSPWWNHKIGLQDFSGRHLTELCFEHFDVVCRVRCQLKIRLPNLKKKRRKKRNIFPDFRCKGTICRHSFSKQQSDELYSQMTINVEQEISSKLCALIFSEHRPD